MSTESIQIFGEVLFDTFPSGEMHLGGAPFNVAWHLQGFGEFPTFISAVGSDVNGETIIDRMRAWGMKIDSVYRSDSYPTGTVSVTFNYGEPVYEIVQNVAYDAIPISVLPPLETKGVLYYGSLASRDLVSRKSLEIVKEKHEGTIFVDINIRLPWFDKANLPLLIKNIDWLKINHEELSLLTGKLFSSDEAVLSLQLEELCRTYTIGHIVVTWGAEGAFLYIQNENRLLFQPAPKITLLSSTVGAGDAFSAAMLMGVVHRWSTEQMIERAARFAGEICQQEGAVNTNQDFYTNVKRELFHAV